MRRTRTTSAAIALPFVATSIAFFGPGIFSGHVPVFRDLAVLMIPLRWFAREGMRSTFVPLWTDRIFFGAPFFANYQSEILYPPSAILYALPFDIGFSAFLAFHLLIAGWGMARYLQSSCDLRSWESVLGGIVYSLGGFLTSLISLTNQLAVAAWMPWALVSTERLLMTGSRRAFVWLTLVIGFQLLGGAPEGVIVTAVLIAAIAARHVWRTRGEWSRCIAIAAALVLAAGMAAPQLLATAEYASQTDRATGLPYDVVTAESIAPRSLLQLLVPHTFEAGSPAFVPEGAVPLFWSLYVGIVPLALAMTAMTIRPFGIWPAAFAASLLLAFGSHTPLFSALYAVAPRAVGAFRFPGKLFLPCHFVLALMSARGLAGVAKEPRTRHIAAIIVGVLFALCVAVPLAASLAPERLLDAFGYSLPPRVGSSAHRVLATRLGVVGSRGAALAIAALVALRLFSAGHIRATLLTATLCGVTAFDLFMVHQPALVFTEWQSLLQLGATRAAHIPPGERIFHYCAGSRCLPQGATGLGPWGGFLRSGEDAEQQARILWASLVPDSPMLYGLGAVSGSDGFYTAMQRDFFRAAALLPREQVVHMLGALGVSRLIGTEPLGPLPSLSEVSGDRETGSWEYEIAGAATRVYLAERVVAAGDTASALERVADPAFQPGRDAVVALADDPQLTGSGGEIRNLAFDLHRIKADLESPKDGLLVVCDTWFPGWEATVDGVSAEVLKVNGIHRGVRVPAGRHTVEMRYRPRWLSLGFTISAIASLLWMATALAALFGRERDS
jgi:Bacterial membrane protein YfhO